MVNYLGEQFLAGAGFPGDQDVGIRSGALGHLIETAVELGTLPDDSATIQIPVRGCAGFFLMIIQRAFDLQQDVASCERLLDIVPCAALDGQFRTV